MVGYAIHVLTKAKNTIQTIEVNTNSRVSRQDEKIDRLEAALRAQATDIGTLKETLASERATSLSSQAAVSIAAATTPPEGTGVG